MKLEQTFTVDAPVQQVWDALIDVPRIAPCLPGAEITEAGEDGTYRGSFVVKLGPTTAAYAGALKMESLDEAGRVATMSGKGTDKRGGGGTTATIVSTVREDPDGGGTRVDVVTDFSITGRLARFGRGGMVQDVANRLLREFAACLQEELAAGAPGAAPPAATAPAPAPPAAAPDAAQSAGPPVAGQPGAAPDASQPAAAPPPPPRAARAPAKPVSGLRLMLGALLDGLRRRIRERRRPR